MTKPILMTSRSRSALLALLLVALSVPALAVDFSYEAEQGALTYRFVPTSGTLSDLEVIYAGRSFRPAAGGGITQFLAGGELIETRDGRHAATLIKESFSNGVYKAKFRWSVDGESFRFTVKLQLIGKTLRVEVTSPSNRIVLFDPGVSKGTPAAKIVDIPYGHNVLFSEGLFTSVLLDAATSQASGILPYRHYVSSSSAAFGSWAHYRPSTDGSRSRLREVVHVTSSARVEDTFYRPSNPVSRHRGLLSNFLVADFWGRSFDAIRSNLEGMIADGFRNIFAIVHVWQRYGYDNGLPTTTPAARALGGQSGLKEVSRLAEDNGYLFGLHTNYVDFYPNSDEWKPKDLALDPSGAPIAAWFNPSTGIQSYLMKPARAARYARRIEGKIHRQYSTSAGFLDVHTAIMPSFKVDFDAKIKGAGRQKTTYESYKALLNLVRRKHKGPLAGEGKGSSVKYWAGYVDAIEADPRSLHQEIAGTRGTRVPTILDYKLKVLHSLFVPHGAGYFERFYRKKKVYTTEQFDRYLATELAFGNAGFFDRRYFDQADRDALRKKYAVLSVLQGHYLSGVPREIRYLTGGEWLDLSDALRSSLPKIPATKVDRKLAERLGVTRVDYGPDFSLYVNRSAHREVPLVAGDITYELGPSDFLALNCDEPIAYVATVGGVRDEFVCSTCAVDSPGGTCSQ